MSRPTPTAEEQARHAKGERLSVHEYDGSPLQPGAHAPGDPAREAKPEEPVSAVELMQHKPVEPEKEGTDEPPKVEEKVATAEAHPRATYRTRRAKAESEDDKDD